MKKTFFLLTLFSATFLACKKKEPSLEKYTLNAFLQKSGFDQVQGLSSFGSTIYEIGTVFEPMVDGSLSAFKVRLPVANNNLQIILWDDYKKAIVATSATIAYPNPNTDLVTKITPVALKKNVKYCVSIVSPQMIRYSRTDGADLKYPIVFSDIKILSQNFAVLQTALKRTYPQTELDKDRFFGNIDLLFQ
jgi:hypothetical protein